VTQFECDPKDPLADVFLAYFGGYPPKEEVSRDYADLVEKSLAGQRIQLKVPDAVDPDAFKVITPTLLTTYMLEWDSPPEWANSGVYVGDAHDFEDIVNFWNLRAADADLIFYDPVHQARLKKLKDAFLEALDARVANSTRWEDSVAVWAKEGRDVDLREFSERESVTRFSASRGTWNGNNLKPARFHIGEAQSILGAVSDDCQRPQLSLQLPEKPFFAEPELHNQEVVVSVSSMGDAYGQDESTFRTPFLPRLNEFYGRRIYFQSNKARVETGGLGIITSVTTSDLSLRAVPRRELIMEIFKAFGMKAKPSESGRIASRLIQQMGGIQGCRVFKIPGVRDLIESVGPQDPFTRSKAVQTIRRCHPNTGIPNFSEYENLFIESRESGPLKPEHAFLFLLKRGVFQVGLSLSCPYCELDPWVPLDDITTETKCEYCGKSFLITPQLRDRDWRYRRSGLFGKENKQEGSIPVALALQQLDTVLNADAIFVTSMNVEPDTARIEPCETDFVAVHQRFLDDKVSVAIGECKTRMEISDDDVRKLSLVADVFEGHGLDAFIVFSKLESFTPDEIARCRTAQSSGKLRVVMLTDRELEPYFVYERTEKEFAIRSSAISLDDLAAATNDISFEPKPKPKTDLSPKP
jgi:hypothetical protein